MFNDITRTFHRLSRKEGDIFFFQYYLPVKKIKIFRVLFLSVNLEQAQLGIDDALAWQSIHRGALQSSAIQAIINRPSQDRP